MHPMFETYPAFLRSDAISPVIEHHRLFVRSPLKGLKRSIGWGFNPLKRVSHRKPGISPEFHSWAGGCDEGPFSNTL
jgi:hypothetical protein